MVAGVGHIQGAVRCKGDVIREVQFAVAGPVFADLAEELALRRIDAELVLHLQGDVEVALLVDGDAAQPSTRDGKLGDELALRGELLHPLVLAVGDENLVGGSDGDANGELKTARLGALLAPLQKKARGGGLCLGCEPQARLSDGQGTEPQEGAAGHRLDGCSLLGSAVTHIIPFGT